MTCKIKEGPMPTIEKVATVGLFVIFASIFSTAGAQNPKTCESADDFLFSCTFDGGARKVGLCHNNGNITYEFGPAQGAADLSMTRNLEDADYTPFAWASRNIFESIALFNGDTRYEVFSSTERGPYNGRTKGGIVVTIPNNAPITLACDAGSVWPLDPLEGIGQINSLMHGQNTDILSHCLRALPYDGAGSSQCIGTYRESQIINGSCDVSSDKTQCWQRESDQWSDLVEVVYTQALAALENNGDAQWLSDLEASQRSWAQTRDLDCKMKGVLPFSPDGGAAMCHAEYAADRMMFLNAVVSFSEFEG
ncbi:MAG TPA: hypothetical protein DC031_12850 [Sulfitobacter sp.]|jgi:uncharacterized protein YecT (DUF1311 family)|nr:hypothetical protein [Sulfitobacter sp.]